MSVDLKFVYMWFVSHPIWFEKWMWSNFEGMTTRTIGYGILNKCSVLDKNKK